MSPPELVATILLTDGSLRPVYDDCQGQYLVDDDGQPVWGLWFLPAEAEVPNLMIFQLALGGCQAISFFTPFVGRAEFSICRSAQSLGYDRRPGSKRSLRGPGR